MIMDSSRNSDSDPDSAVNLFSTFVGWPVLDPHHLLEMRHQLH